MTADGATPAVVDLETATVDDVAPLLDGADAVVFAAGAGPGSGAARKDTVDRGAAVLLGDAAERAGVRRYLLVSSVGVDAVADGRTPAGMDDVFVAYLRAKLAAEQDLLGRSGLDDDGRCAPAASPTTRAPAGSPSPRTWSRAASPGTTSQPCCSRSWTPGSGRRSSRWSAGHPDRGSSRR